jgi:AAA family ATP:ADP antiporter
MLFSTLKNQKTILRANLLFFLMFGIVCLLNVNYAILRSARNALTVADLGGGAGSIPWFELCGAMPGAVLMTLGLTWMLNRFSIRRVFFTVLAVFVLFFLGFSLGVYPLLPKLREYLLSCHSIPSSFTELLPKFASMLFFVMAELWKIALLTILFWGFVNQYISLDTAKKYYAPLMLGGSVGTIAASPIITFCTSDRISGQSWSDSLFFMMAGVALISLATAWLFSCLCRSLKDSQPQTQPQTGKKEEEPSLSVWESMRICFKSKYLLLLAWLTIADYIAYALGEVIFLDILKQKFPDPRDYCDFMGQLSFWNGLLTAVSALFITPYLLRRCRWVVASLVTPICLLVSEGAFFFALYHPSFSLQLDLLVVLGALFFCIVRAAKYTLFDTSKELSFILLPPLEKMQGKLVIDGMCARLGRGSGSMISLTLIQLCGGVLATVPVAGAIAIAIAGSCVFATSSLGHLVEKRARKVNAEG